MEHGGEGMATAQAIKAATLAYFILQNSPPASVFLHFQGAYHSDKYEGIVYYLKKQVDVVKSGSVVTVTQENIDELLNDNEGLADFIICVKENVTSTH